MAVKGAGGTSGRNTFGIEFGSILGKGGLNVVNLISSHASHD